jgi:hypothetical protein
MIDRLIFLITERAFGGVLQAVPHPAMCHPNTCVQCKLEEEFNLRWRQCLPKFLRSKQGRHAEEKGIEGIQTLPDLLLQLLTILSHCQISLRK